VHSKTENTNKKKIWLIPVCILLAAAFIVLIAFAAAAEEKALIRKRIQTFYDATYVAFDYEAAKNSLAEDVREDFDSVMSMGGMVSSMFDTYRNEAIVELESDTFTVEVRMKSIEDCDVRDIAALQASFPGTEKAVLAEYDVVFILETGEEKAYSRDLYLVYKDGGWFMTTHVVFPIGPNMYVSHE